MCFYVEGYFKLCLTQVRTLMLVQTKLNGLDVKLVQNVQCKCLVMPVYTNE